MLIAQISDPHLAGWGKKTFGVAPMAENLARCVAHINQLNPQPDLALVTGDIANDGLQEAYEQAAGILGQLRCPFYVIPGNHDDRARLMATFGEQSCPSASQTFVNYVIEGHDLRLITVDSVIVGAPGGEICADRAAWLDARLNEAKTQPTVIFMHHPPVNFGVPETDIDGFIGAERLGDMVEKHANVERILCGHIHLPALVRWRGTVVTTAPSIGMRLTLDLTLEFPSEFILEEPSYQLHYWSPEKNLITHTVKVRDNERSYPFEDVKIKD